MTANGASWRPPYGYARTHGLIVVGNDAGTDADDDAALHVQVRDDAAATTLTALDELRRHTGRALRLTLCDPARFEQQLAATYSRTDQTAAEVADDIGQEMDLSRLVQELPPIEDLLESEDDAPIIRMINALFTQAVREQASDIHVEAFEQHSTVRFRIDGVLHDVIHPHRALHAAMASRIKIMAQLDIAEKRMPQDGRITIRIAGKPIDVRVSTIPTSHGERIVMRLLDKDPARLHLDVLGMAADTLGQVDRLIRQPHGIFLVTGPTGSGKTTTLYAALSRLDATRLNIMTVEDPVEYDLAHIGQTQVNPRIGLDFAKALRSILRQDPDVIMIGEIRDLETAQIAVQASLTGHMVLATLHTNDTASAVTRLVDMGIEPFLLASSLAGVLAQRLVRRLCPECKQARPATPEEEAQFTGHPTAAPRHLYHPHGCPSCNHTGYQGRMGIYELLEVDDALRRMIHAGSADQALREHALGAGTRPLREDGLRWVLAGETTLEEILRVTRD
ncbi:general secretory pathway component, cryptic [Sterolibacterium denitrificans]|uniref:Type II secretion system protein E n=1 Tax=Sterolibacterium denitrificans TaxID=157592 RepID=A0A7Z7HQT7_9PROT|nr:type II secretion system ATPase GspE [Sterolibacterium denitrificans]SMB25936.1 general secretory pathway component, cryptic [Sterolibacterium denitrificans]